MTSFDQALEKQAKTPQEFMSKCPTCQFPGCWRSCDGQHPSCPAEGCERSHPNRWGHPPHQHPASESPAALTNKQNTQLFSTYVYFASYRAYYQAFCTVNAVSGLKPIELHSCAVSARPCGLEPHTRSVHASSSPRQRHRACTGWGLVCCLHCGYIFSQGTCSLC